MNSRRFHQSLIFRISAAIILVQVLLMAVLGAYYVDRFASQVDKRVVTQIKAPAQLMNSGTLGFEAISQQDTIQQIVGSEILDALIIGPERVVFYSANSSDVGQHVSQIPRLSQELFQGNFDDMVYGRDTDDNYVSISPIYSAAGRAPFLAVYIKANGADIQKEKVDLIHLFVIGSVLAALFISGVIILSFRMMVLRGLRQLTKASVKISEGQLGKPVLADLPQTQDEIGELSQAFRNMALEIGKSRARLQGYSKQLEKEVATRTAELKQKVDELGRLNKVMIGREVKMAEMKKAMREMEQKLKPK